MNEFHCKKKSVNTEVFQKSSVSLIFFTIYFSEIFEAIKTAVSAKILFFVNDLDFVMTAESVNMACERLKQVGKAAIEWGQSNAVWFDAEKIETMMFTRKGKHILREQI